LGKREQERVICLNRGELLTEEKIIPFQRHPGKAPGVDPEHNIVKLAVLSGIITPAMWALAF